jgi:hypothetical protein
LNRETMESFTAEEEIYFVGNEVRRVRWWKKWLL